MKRIYTYGGSLEKRNLTVADIIESKKSGKKLTQVTAQNAEEAEIISDQNVDMIITGSDWFADVRSGARNTFITAALFAGRYITNEEILEGAIKAAMEGADSVLTPRGLGVVEMLANEGLAVQGHVGMVPSSSTQLGGLRTVGKTAEEAMKILDDMRRLEDAGAFGAEVECVADDALEEIKKHTSLVINSLGSGSSGDVIFLFFEDICGETGNPPGKMPRHAKSWGDGAAIRQQLDKERRKAIKGFSNDVKEGSFPDKEHIVSMLPGEKDQLIKALNDR
jgi:3-methyl-2-oxobutanoate hydroxymethyltransferase